MWRNWRTAICGVDGEKGRGAIGVAKMMENNIDVKQEVQEVLK
jgi:hypothetical protein